MNTPSTSTHFPIMGQYYTSDDIVKLLGIKRDTLTSMYRYGLPYFSSGGGAKARRLVREDDLQEYMKGWGLAQRIIEGMVADGELVKAEKRNSDDPV